MAEVKVYNIDGKETEILKLEDSVFGLPANDDLVHQVYVSLAANQRQSLADTKTRGERAGSGIKPWKQKGTGRARVGSVRTPLWRKGGVVFGPKSERNFKKKINKKMNARAIALTLSGKLRDGELKVIDEIKLEEKKAKKMAESFKKLGLSGKVLMVFMANEKDYMIASRNLKQVENTSTDQINVLEMMNAKNLVLSKESVRYLEKKYKA